ncbi:hypothetical protein A2609_02605 [Candidatus Kaiserbacteria bacterium RIFOXYD1_FULL_47_14]|uniref:Uncharacterized protein n=1 Tax=Candidatus Kaiserbacteria bacterium RIFOXYD1_FULL_47_14 TaxID=1798533 RepID=A0A1F6G4W0_9BACT|nr:MAG: hypothetical protein A2609_02605 [Candidatus Kaiserbacteria bacterium RIFOXYD1_FULL_47_14]
MNKILYIVGILIIIVAASYWYFSAKPAQAPTTTESTAVEQTQIPPLASGNTTADISADLNQVPDTSAALDQAATASAQAVQGF